MRYLTYAALAVVVVLLVAGIVYTEETKAQGPQQFQDFDVELAGNSVPTEDGDKWPYWRLLNANDIALPQDLLIIETGFLNIPKEDYANLGEFEGVDITIADDGSFRATRRVSPCAVDAIPNSFNKIGMVPANGSLIIFYPPIFGGTQEVIPSIRSECEAWEGYYPTDEVKVLESTLTPDGKDLLVTITATDALEGKAFAQIQVELLNEQGEVVAKRYGVAGEFTRVTAGDTEIVNIINVDRISFSDYRLNVLALASP